MKDTKSGNSARTRARERPPLALGQADLEAIRALIVQARAQINGEPLEKAAKLLIVATFSAVLDAVERGDMHAGQWCHLTTMAQAVLPHVTGKQDNEIPQKGW